MCDRAGECVSACASACVFPRKKLVPAGDYTGVFLVSVGEYTRMCVCVRVRVRARDIYDASIV